VSDTSKNTGIIAFPASIHGRLDAERGFSRLQSSADELSDNLKNEINEFALSGWGSKPPQIDYEIESVGHLRSRVDISLMHVLCVRPLPNKQPVRAVVTVPMASYRRFGCNPFVFARARFFDFLDPFMTSPKADGVCAPAVGAAFANDPPPERMKQWDDATLGAAIAPLLDGGTRIIASSTASQTTRDIIEEIVWAMPIELRSQATIVSYAFIDRTAVDAVAPALIGIYEKNAPTVPRREGYGQPTARAMTAILSARHVREGAAAKELADGRLVHLYEMIREVQARLDEPTDVPGRTAASPSMMQPIARSDEQLVSLRDTMRELHDRVAHNERSVTELEQASKAAEQRAPSWRPGRALVWTAAGICGVTAVILPFFLYDGKYQRLRDYVGMNETQHQAAMSGSLAAKVSDLERRIGVEGTTGVDTLKVRIERARQEVDTLALDIGNEKIKGRIPGELETLGKDIEKLNQDIGLVAQPAATSLIKARESLSDTIKSLQGQIETMGGTVKAIGTALEQEKTISSLRQAIRALPTSDRADGEGIALVWQTEEQSGRVTVSAFELAGTPKGELGDPSKIAFTPTPTTQFAEAIGNQTQLSFKPPQSSQTPLEIHRLDLKVGKTNPRESLPMYVAICWKGDDADSGTVIRVLGLGNPTVRRGRRR
jgi:hypothetical protein